MAIMQTSERWPSVEDPQPELDSTYLSLLLSAALGEIRRHQADYHHRTSEEFMMELEEAAARLQENDK